MFDSAKLFEELWRRTRELFGRVVNSDFARADYDERAGDECGGSVWVEPVVDFAVVSQRTRATPRS